MEAGRKGYLEEFGLTSVLSRDIMHRIWGGDQESAEDRPDLALQKWLQQLPDVIMAQINLALQQERPFMPPDVTPEMMAESNSSLPSMNHVEILYRCLDFAMRAKDYKIAAAIIYVVDRACYRFGRSGALLNVLDEIMQVSPETPVAPQVVLRKARVLKDTGDLHGSMKILDAVISKECKWEYKDNIQYENTKAVCVQIKGQILHNLGLWKEAITPLVDSVHSFKVVRDNKGISSSLGLLSRCLNKLSTDDFINLRIIYPDVFQNNHHCYEAYVQGLEAVRLIQDLGATLYITKHQLVADESLLMFAILQQAVSKEHHWFQTILDEMKKSLAGHRTVRHLHSIESFFEFVRAVFMINLTLAFSPSHQDVDLARFLEKLSIELYSFMCARPGDGEDGSMPSSSLTQTNHSVRLMNGVLALLGLPPLEGNGAVEQKDVDEYQEEKESDYSIKDGAEESSHGSSPPRSLSSSSNQVSSQSQPSSWEVISSSPSASVPSNLSAVISQSLPSSDSWEMVSAHSSSTHASGDGEQNPQSHLRNFSEISATFPAVSIGKSKSRFIKPSGDIQMKFVGLPVSRDQLKSATCPTSVQETMKSLAEDEMDGPKLELQGLLISAATIASTSSSKLASSGESDLHATVDLSSTTQSTPSETHDTSVYAEVCNKPDQDSYANSVQNDHSSLSSSKDSGQKASVEKSIEQLSSSSSVVDLSATTKSTSSDTSNDDIASPLVDLSAPTVCSIMAELKLGDSVPTSDSAEFLCGWTPSDNSSVYRAELWLYNPVNGQWSAQTTLAYLGPMLKTDRKGSFRDAFFVSYLHQDEPLGRYVGKRYRQQRKPEVYMQDVVCQMLAAFYVTQFNQALQKCTDDILRIQYLTAAHLQLLNTDGKVVDWINVEPFLQGSFLKLTSNLRYVSPDLDNEKGVEVATALSHFSYVKSSGNLMVVDLQGWLPSDKKGVVYLTDPVFNTRNIQKFSTCDQREAGMQAFWKHVHPKCNKICRFLQLDKLRPDNETPTS